MEKKEIENEKNGEGSLDAPLIIKYLEFVFHFFLSMDHIRERSKGRD